MQAPNWNFPTSTWILIRDALAPAPLKILHQAIISELSAACIHTNDLGQLTMLVASMTFSWCSKTDGFHPICNAAQLKKCLGLAVASSTDEFTLLVNCDALHFDNDFDGLHLDCIDTIPFVSQASVHGLHHPTLHPCQHSAPPQWPTFSITRPFPPTFAIATTNTKIQMSSCMLTTWSLWFGLITPFVATTMPTPWSLAIVSYFKMVPS